MTIFTVMPCSAQVRAVLLLFGFITAAASAAEQDTLIPSPAGQLKKVLIGQTPVPVETDFQLVGPAWEKIYSPGTGAFKPASHTDLPDNGEYWLNEGTIDGQRVSLTAEVDRSMDSPRLMMRVKSSADIELEGIYWAIHLPVAWFSEGYCTVFDTLGASRVQLPKNASAQPEHLLATPGSRLLIELPQSSARLHIAFPPAENVIIQDNQYWGMSSYCILIKVHHGTLAADTFIGSALQIRGSGILPTIPGLLKLSDYSVPRPFAGFGGNYCFQFDTPATALTLDTLAPQYLRTELDLAHWQPSPEVHQPNSPEILSRLKLYRQLNARKVPVIASVWTGPEWMFDQPGRGFWTNGRSLLRQHWAPMIQCISSYLAYCRQQTGWEPELFSFNEPGLGIRIKLSADELAAIYTALAEEFARRGIRTKILLGDTASPQFLDYTIATYDAVEKKEIFAAVGFHTWGGATAEKLRAWYAFAERAGLPLIASEVGFDGASHHTPWVFDDHEYALTEAALYCHILSQGTVRSTLHWQLTPDYGLVAIKDGVAVPNRTRFAQMRHFFSLVPPQARHLKIAPAANPNLQACALAGGDDAAPHFTLHCLNSGGRTRLTVQGVPKNIPRLEILLTDATHAAKQMPPVILKDGQFEIEITGRSLWSFHTARQAEKNSSLWPSYPPPEP